MCSLSSCEIQSTTPQTMIVQEPVQAAIWHCLTNCDYTDAIFLSERLYAEDKTDESLYLLATSYFRNGQKDYAYYTLKGRTGNSRCRYLFSFCAYELEKYGEAEDALLEKSISENYDFTGDEFIKEYGDQTSFALMLLGKIAAKTERTSRAVEAWNKALKLNPFLWSCFEQLCKIGEKPNPQTIFQIGNVENISLCHGNSINNINNVIITNGLSSTDTQDVTVNTPLSQVLTNLNPVINMKPNSLSTPEENPSIQQIHTDGDNLSGIWPLSTDRSNARPELDLEDASPTFGHLYVPNGEFMNTPSPFSPILLAESKNHHQSPRKRFRDELMTQWLTGRKESKPITLLSTNVPIQNTTPIPHAGQPGQNVRRSSRLFSNNYSVKENNKTPPNANKFVTPKSPSRKTKQRTAKCNSNKNYSEMNTRNKIEKEKSETVTSESKPEKIPLSSTPSDNCLQQMIHMQKQSAEGLMYLLRNIGQAYLNMSQFNCVTAIDQLHSLPLNQVSTSWVYSLLGLCYFEQADYEMSIKYFGEVHEKEPYRLEFMDVYSTALWHLQKEVSLSALAKDLLDCNRNSPITWCVNGNCFSLHKEHDTAIKFFQRAVQVDPNFPYAYTLLGHEYITTEELDKAMSCFNNAIRLDSRHYNAWFGMGTIYSKQERYRLAEMYYKKALAVNPKSCVILCHIGVVQHALKETLKALATFNAAIAYNPKSPLCKFHRGSIYFALGRHNEALKELEELKEIVPKESLVYYLIGKVHKKLGNTDLALMHFSWATDLDPKGASSQIKEAFDPSIGNSTDIDLPNSPTPDEYQSESNSGIRPIALNFNNLDDSEDSF